MKLAFSLPHAIFGTDPILINPDSDAYNELIDPVGYTEAVETV